MKTPKNLSGTSFICMFLFTMLAVVLFPGRIQAFKSHGTPSAKLPPGVSADWWTTAQENIRKTEYHATIDPLSESADRTVRKPWKSRPPSGSGGGLSESADWSAGSDQADASFGFSVGTAGDVNGDGISDVIVGAYFYDTYNTDDPPVIDKENAGRAYVFYGSADGLSTIPAWTAVPDKAYAYFGCSVGTAGDVNGDGVSDVIVGAFGVDKAYVFYGSIDGLSTIPAWTAVSDQAGARFGVSVGTAGDVNGDGYSDVIVGAYFYDTYNTDDPPVIINAAGRAYVFYGSVDGLSTIPAWTAVSDKAYAYFGYSVGTAGDVNGDGVSDVIVGAFGVDKAYVFHGSDSDAGMSTTADWEASGQAEASFGLSVGTAGDVNGDGISDVIVGAYLYDTYNTDDPPVIINANAGRAYVFHGSDAGLSASADWSAESDQADAGFGVSVGTAGDVNNDGVSDVIVGAYFYDTYNTDDPPVIINANAGRTYVFHGSDAGMSTTADWTAESDQADAWFGISVGTAGDVNGDEISDVIVGARMYNNTIDDDKGGRAFAYYGSSDSICFIGTAAYGSPMESQIGFVATMALMFFLVASLVGLIGFRKVKK